MILAQIYLYGLPDIDGEPEKVERKKFDSVQDLKKHLIELQNQFCEKGDLIEFKKSTNAKGYDILEVYTENCDFNYFGVYTGITSCQNKTTI